MVRFSRNASIAFTNTTVKTFCHPRLSVDLPTPTKFSYNGPNQSADLILESLLRMLNFLTGFAGLLLIGLVMVDTFETILLPRRVARRLRFSSLFSKTLWLSWRAVARRIKSDNRREYMLSYFGPLSLLMLLAAWAVVIIVGFALLQWGVCAPLIVHGNQQGFESYLYMSGITFFTVGYGDVVPTSTAGHFVA